MAVKDAFIKNGEAIVQFDNSSAVKVLAEAMGSDTETYGIGGTIKATQIHFSTDGQNELILVATVNELPIMGTEATISCRRKDGQAFRDFDVFNMRKKLLELMPREKMKIDGIDINSIIIPMLDELSPTIGPHTDAARAGGGGTGGNLGR